MSDLVFHSLRRFIALAGGRSSHAPLDALMSRSEQAGYGSARLVEAPLSAINPGPALRCDLPLAFLDGVQRTQLVGQVGTMPVLGARIAAGVRLRTERRTHGVVARDMLAIVARPEALAALPNPPAGVTTLPIIDEESPHPIGDLERGRAQVDRARIGLEIEVAAAFRRDHPDTWLMVDGSITASTDWSTDPHMAGVIKSHSTLWFEGAELETYLTLPAGMRTSVFVPATRHVTPVHSWGLRLWPWAGRDMMHGLVRIETAERPDAAAHANLLSRWLLAERAPVSDDSRQDRLLYGIHDVERWLRARSA